MSNDEYFLIDQCKKLTEARLGWKDSKYWKQRDYNNLIQLIEDKTGISLSLSTIRRIWDENYRGMPQPATLDALAQFADYKSWLDFKEHHKQGALAMDRNPKPKISRTAKTLIYSVLGVMIIITLFVFFRNRTANESAETLQINSADIQFSCNKSVSKGVPTTVIFNYDVSAVSADSFFVQQKWNENNRYKINKQDHNLTTVYYIPGHHKAKLVANDSIIKEIDIRINTEDWLASVRYGYADDFPVFISSDNLRKDGVLYLSTGELEGQKVEINNNSLLSYFYVEEFEKAVNSSDFSFETRVKCDKTYNFTCPHISVCVLGEGSMCMVPLIVKGCIGEAMVKVGDAVKYGSNNDLSAFGVDVYEWQKVRLDVKDKKALIYFNDAPIYELEFNQDVGRIAGFSLHFSGTGMIDYVRLEDEHRAPVYLNEFDS